MLQDSGGRQDGSYATDAVLEVARPLSPSLGVAVQLVPR